MQADVYQRSIQQSFYDEFDRYAAGNYTLTKGTGGTAATVVAAGLTAGGWLNVPTAASAANDYYSVSTLTPMFEFLAGKPLHVEGRLLITESGAQLTSFYFGLTDTLTTGFLASTGLPPASWKGAVIYKTKTSDNLVCRVSNGTVKTSVTIGKFVSGKPLLLGLTFDPAGGTTCYIKPEVQGYNDNASLYPIQPISFLLAGVAPMYLSAGIVTSTTAAETLALDYWAAESYRT